MTAENELKKNGSGYKDLTAYKAIKSIEKEKHHNPVDDIINPLLKGARAMFGAAGFEIVGRIILKDMQTGREYR